MTVTTSPEPHDSRLVFRSELSVRPRENSQVTWHIHGSSDEPRSWSRYKQTVYLVVGTRQRSAEVKQTLYTGPACDHVVSQDLHKTTRHYSFQHTPDSFSETIYLQPKPDDWRRSVIHKPIRDQKELPPPKKIPWIVLKRRYSQPDYDMMRDKFVNPVDRYQRRHSLTHTAPPCVSRMQDALTAWREVDGAEEGQNRLPRRAMSVQYSGVWRGFGDAPPAVPLRNSRHRASLQTLPSITDEDGAETGSKVGEEAGAFFRWLSMESLQQQQGAGPRRPAPAAPRQLEKRNSFVVLDSL